MTNETPDLCHSAIKHKDVYVNWGQSVHLPCKFNGFIQETQDLQQLLNAQQRQQSSQQQQQQQMQLQRLSSNGLPQAGGYLSPNSQPQLTIAAQTIAGNLQASLGQPHGLLQPAQYIQWYYHRRDNVLAPGYPVLQRRDKFILAADQGLVIMNANEPGWYQCRLGNQIIYSYNLIIDTSEYKTPSFFLATAAR